MNNDATRASVGSGSWAIHRWAQLGLAIYLPFLAVSTHWPSLQIGADARRVTSVRADKLMHFGVFVVLTTLLIYALPAGRRGFGRNLAVGTILAGIYGYVDEYTQQWFMRVFSFVDVIANLIGVLCTFLILFVGQTAPDASTGRLRFYRAFLAVAGVAIAWVVISSAILEAVGPIARTLGAMVLTWLLAASRPAGRDRGGTNVVVCLGLVALLGVVIQAAEQHRTPNADVVAMLWHQAGLFVGLCGWALFALVRHACHPQVLRWQPILAPCPAAAPAAPVESTHHFVGQAVVVGALTGVSRVTGLLRDAVFAAIFGMGVITEAFYLGFLVPNLFRRLFGEGALGASFIPVYSDFMRRDRLTARRLASICLALMIVVLGALTLIGEGVLVWLASVEGRSPDTVLAIKLTMTMLPYMPMICLVAILGAMLQVHGRYGAPAAAPIVLNVTLIVGALLATRGYEDEQVLRLCIPTVAVCVLVAGLLQLLWQVAAVLDVERFTANLADGAVAMGRVLRAMGPMVIGLSVFQINTLLDSLIAYGFSPKTGWAPQMNLLGLEVPYPVRVGTISALHWSQRLYQFPLGVFGIAIATAIFPALAIAAPKADRTDSRRFASILRQGLRLTVFIGLPASVGLVLVRLPLTRLIYERGRFGIEESYFVASILAAYGSAVWAYSMSHVVTRAFYAVEDARTPMRISMGMVGLNLVLNLTLIWILDAPGLAWSTAICAVVQVLLLLRAMRRHVSHSVDGEVWRSWRRSMALCAVMAVVLGPTLFLFELGRMEPAASALVLAAMVAAGTAIYLGGAWLIGADELRWLITRKVNRERGEE